MHQQPKSHLGMNTKCEQLSGAIAHGQTHRRVISKLYFCKDICGFTLTDLKLNESTMSNHLLQPPIIAL